MFELMGQKERYDWYFNENKNSDYDSYLKIEFGNLFNFFKK